MTTVNDGGDKAYPMALEDPDEPMSFEVEDRFVITPMWLLESGVSDGAYRQYGWIRSHFNEGDGYARPTRRRLAEKQGVTLRTVDRRMAELIEQGAVVTFKRWTNALPEDHPGKKYVRKRTDEFNCQAPNGYLLKTRPPDRRPLPIVPTAGKDANVSRGGDTDVSPQCTQMSPGGETQMSPGGETQMSPELEPIELDKYGHLPNGGNDRARARDKRKFPTNGKTRERASGAYAAPPRSAGTVRPAPVSISRAVVNDGSPDAAAAAARREARLAGIPGCPRCDDGGYLPDRRLCDHDPDPEATAARRRAKIGTILRAPTG